MPTKSEARLTYSQFLLAYCGLEGQQENLSRSCHGVFVPLWRLFVHIVFIRGPRVGPVTRDIMLPLLIARVHGLQHGQSPSF